MPISPRPLEFATLTHEFPARHVGITRPKSTRTDALVSPALALVRHAEERNERNRHENLGFLSLERGFLPRADPRLRLPNTHRAWDEVAAELPQLYASLNVRERIDELPLLDASKRNLADEDVLRATALVAILCHAYWYCKPTATSQLPEVLAKPWAQLRARLGRRQEALTYIDLIVYNWRRKDPDGPITVENLSLLFPTIGNQEEQVFYLTQLEILARCTDVLRTMLTAQGAVLAGNAYRVETALCALAQQLEGIVRTSLPKINPHPHSQTYVDAVTWAKTVAPFAVPIHTGDLGPSGTSSPIFNALDIFLGRKQYTSFLGKEIQQLRTVYPPFWRAFMLALSRVNLGSYIAETSSASLRDAYQLANDAYAGTGGFLGRHRMKVYGFLELAFKVGRAVTIGGFGGAFKDRTWDQVDSELVQSRVERPVDKISELPRARVSHVPGTHSPNSTLHRLRLTVDGTQRVQYQAGDHVQVWPEHPQSLVARTLRAAGASGHEPVELSTTWQRNLVRRGITTTAPTLGAVLPFASLQHTSPRVAKRLLSVAPNSWLRLSLEAGRLQRIELWRVLERLRAEGYPLERLLESPSLLCDILEPEEPRTYSIASGSPHSVWGAKTFDLAVRLHTHESGVGTASSFLCRAADTDVEVPFSVQRAAAFGPPPDSDIPVIGFAAGSGVAPMLSLFAERCRNSSTRNWLILSLSRTEDFQFGDDWAPAVASGQLRLDVVFTRQGATLQHSGDGFTIAPGTNRHIQDLLRETNVARDLHSWLSGSRSHPAASVYICGNGSFANTAMRCLESVVASRSFGDEATRLEAGRTALFEMAGQRRLTIEAHTDATPFEDDGLFTPADVADHNCEANGYWVSIHGVVYDLSQFRLLHPGGARILDAYAGMDATHGFSRAHDGRPDIAAQLQTYRKGRLYTPHFDTKTVTIETPQGPRPLDHAALYRAYVTALNLCTEMQNALRIDLSLADQTVHPQTPGTSPYVWARQAETHHRFLATYVSVLSADTLPNLDALARALHGAPEEKELPAWHASEDGARLAADNLEAARFLVSRVCAADLQSDGLRSQITALVNQDQQLLSELKELLRRAVNAVAYRESAELHAMHPTLALNALCRLQVDEYQRTIAGFR